MNPKRGPSIFRVTTLADWDADRVAGRLAPNADDRRDGFLHFSAIDQVAGTIAKHRAGVTGRLVLEIDAAALGSALRWEPSRGGAWFPHVYGDCPAAAVVGVRAWPDDRATDR